MKFSIAESLIPVADEKIAKFVKKFKKFGAGSFTYTKGQSHYESCTAEDGTKFFSKMVDIDIEGSYKIDNYVFVASLEYVEEVGKNLVKKAPNSEDIPEMYLTRNVCDHCKTNRNRKYTVLLKNTVTGEYIQVGKSCVKDFIGYDITDYMAFLNCFSCLEEFLEKTASGVPGGWEIAFTVDEVLQQTVAYINKNDGYISKATVDKWYQRMEDAQTDSYVGLPPITTASTIFSMFYGSEEVRVAKCKITDEIVEQVNTIKDFILNSTDNSDYINNLKILITAGYVVSRNLGLVVSMVGYYLRKINENKQYEEKAQSEYIGNVGDKITFTATPKCVCAIETVYGVMRIYTFSVDNNEVVWKTSKVIEETPTTFKATIKAHTLYKGIKQTEITRARIA